MQRSALARERDVEFGRTVKAMREFLSFEEWPGDTLKLFFAKTNLRYTERIRLGCFLIANGYRKKHVLTVLAPRLRDTSAKIHLQRVAEDVLGDKYDSRWSYFDVRCQDYLYLNGRACGEPRPHSRRHYMRKLKGWEDFCAMCYSQTGAYPTFAQQLEYFSEP
jgi:hypothetical protein